MILLGNRISRIFSIYAAVNYALIAVLQSAYSLPLECC
jgi:hypothetical protein